MREGSGIQTTKATCASRQAKGEQEQAEAWGGLDGIGAIRSITQRAKGHNKESHKRRKLTFRASLKDIMIPLAGRRLDMESGYFIDRACQPSQQSAGEDFCLNKRFLEENY